MEVFRNWSLLKKKRKPIVLAVGFFDGLHIGHRKVVDATLARARAIGGKAWVLTFDTHPMKVLNPGAAPLLLTSTDHKVRLMRQLELDGCLVMTFTRRLAGLEPERFVQQLRQNVPALKEVFVGRDWRFGKRAAGTPVLLSRLGRDMGFAVNVVRPVVRTGQAVSSSRIRKEILRGDLNEAAHLLGRPFSVLGTVTKGRAVGRTLGYPTANLDPHNEALPPQGVYAVRVKLHPNARTERLATGVINIGVRPTFGDAQESRSILELHLFDLDRELYGRDIEVFFFRKLRNERKFHSPEKLSRQIARDCAQACHWLGYYHKKI